MSEVENPGEDFFDMDSVLALWKEPQDGGTLNREHP